ncbi:hypothetical protein BD289DRAFT_481537 [Coniella lustricola]|uniref:Uncharacterized protein n=1 Tax=Coniella lustricola TaxID=2025994 RepID=A0A2T3ABY2_9PEZI|nr:hypothetical protein BD289DRAFT_481537 [Coniella lustricola]
MALQHPIDSPASEPQAQTLQVILTPPDRGQITVIACVRTNHDPAKYGFDILFPDTPLDTFRGFPVCEAYVHTQKKSGYASMYGWTQLVKDSLSDSKTWEFDYIPVSKELNWPFCWFGPEPTLFDGPARVNVSDLDWTARSFLTYIPDTLLSKRISHVLGFEWGFVIKDGQITVKKLISLEAADWNSHVEYFSGKFPGWTFMPHLN